MVTAVTSVNLNGIGMTSQRTRERLVGRLVEQGITDTRVLEIMRTTPRHLFLDEAMAHRAYEDTSLPIGFQQTLSRPYIVARMTELLLADGPLPRVLEVGSGSGYQTAVLAQLVDEVWSVERIKPLLTKARQRLRQLRIRNVNLRHADGTMGWEEAGPFDGIISTAAPEHIPDELLRQLAVGGRLVIPVGGDTQQLQVVTRSDQGVDVRIVEAVHFVPLRPGTVK